MGLSISLQSVSIKKKPYRNLQGVCAPAGGMSNHRLNPLTFWMGCITAIISPPSGARFSASYQSVCWSSMTRRILALLDTPARSAASDKVAAAAAVVCLTALDMEEKKPEPPLVAWDWLLD